MNEQKQQSPRVYEIPESHLEFFVNRFERLQRRAKKLGCEQAEYQILAFEDRQAWLMRDGIGDCQYKAFVRPYQYERGQAPLDDGWNRRDLGYAVRFYFVTISGIAPKLNGWSFLGEVEAVRDEEGEVIGNLLKLLPEVEVPVEYRDAKPWCDHCGIERHWNSTFIVKHEDGTTKQVGRRCLKDFTGHKSPDQIASNAEILMQMVALASDAEDEDWELGGGGRWTERYYTLEVLTRASVLIRLDGWHPRSFGVGCTADDLQKWYSLRESELDRWEKNHIVTDYDKQLAADTIEWMLSLEDKETKSDYEHNLCLLARAGRIEMKTFGLAASSISAYMRAHDRALARAAAAKKEAVSEYVGELKKRMEMTVTLAMTRDIETMYGTLTIFKFFDENGNVIVWKSTSAVDILPGSKLRVKATVKEHKEWGDNKIKQTTVSRLVILETLPEESINPQGEVAAA